MSLWIKICANTSLQDAQFAVDAGADALGFIFAPSPRLVTRDQVARIAPLLPKNIEKIGVFVNATLDQIVSSVRDCRLTGVQLHSDAEAAMPTLLRDALGSDLRILRVVHFNSDAAEQAAIFAEDPAIDAVLVDSRTATAVGGTGISFDWDTAQQTVFGPRASVTKLIVAGGLNPANITEAVIRLRPWGVDVASGVEQSPGKKDPAKVREFVRLARVAAQHNI